MRRGTNERMYGYKRMTGRSGGGGVRVKPLTGLIRHLGYCSHCDRHPSRRSEKFKSEGTATEFRLLLCSRGSKMITVV